jgi:hypothetical protein
VARRAARADRLHRNRHLSRAPRLDAPTLILHGSQDDINPLAASETFAATAPEGVVRLEVIDGAAHVWAWNRDPARYNRLLAEHLRSVTAPPASSSPRRRSEGGLPPALRHRAHVRAEGDRARPAPPADEFLSGVWSEGVEAIGGHAADGPWVAGVPHTRGRRKGVVRLYSR